MGGKAAVFLVLGFSLIFLVVGHNFNNLSVSAIDNLTKYYSETTAHNIAVSGANMAASEIFFNKNWEAGYQNLSFKGGTLNVYVSNNAAISGKVPICHIPPGNPAAAHTIVVSASAVPAHLAHGDFIGGCDAEPIDEKMAVVISEGTFNGVTKTVIVELRPSYFSKFGNFYTTISAYPATGDTFNGPFHVNAKLKTWGTPVFWGKTTSRNGLKTYGSPQDPKFYGGFQSGVDIPLEFDTSGFRYNASTGGKIFNDTTGSGQTTEVKLYFNADATVNWSQKIGSGSWSTPQTTPLSALAPNGLIYVEKGNIYTKGTVNGAVTIVATKQNQNGYGRIFQEDDLLYANDPTADPSSKDVLGMVAEDDIRIVYGDDTKHNDIYTQASMFSLTGNIGPDDNLVSNDGYLAQWNILGGLIASTTRVTAHYTSTAPYEGYKFVHTYDERFSNYVPPFFPHTRNFEVVSWYE